jgi:hypothetical protein
MALLMTSKKEKEQHLYDAAMKSLFNKIEHIGDFGVKNQVFRVSNQELDGLHSDIGIRLWIHGNEQDAVRLHKWERIHKLSVNGIKIYALYHHADEWVRSHVPQQYYL